MSRDLLQTLIALRAWVFQWGVIYLFNEFIIGFNVFYINSVLFAVANMAKLSGGTT